MWMGGWVSWGLASPPPPPSGSLSYQMKVPSHLTIKGNNEADRLATVGLHAHPLYPFRQTPHKEAMVANTSPPPLKRARTDPCTPVAMEVSQLSLSAQTAQLPFFTHYVLNLCPS